MTLLITSFSCLHAEGGEIHGAGGWRIQASMLGGTWT